MEQKNIQKSQGKSVPVSDRTRIGKNITAQKKSQNISKTRISSNISVKKNTGVRPKSNLQRKNPERKTIFDRKDEIKSIFKSTATRAFIYIAVVVLVSTILSIIGIKWANDLFALVKDETVATVTIPQDATVSEVSKIPSDNGIIEYPFVFRMYVGFKYSDANEGNGLTFKDGEHEVNSTLNYDQLVSLLRYRLTREVVTLTIPEGYSIDEIIEFFTSKGMGTKDGFVGAINNYPYEYKFMDELNKLTLSKDRKYRLEGYLFPDTYEFYTDATEVDIVDKMLSNFERKFEEAYYGRITELKLNIDQAVTLASMIQKEVKFSSEFYTVSGVFHNRMNSSSFSKFESCATVQYILDERKEVLSYEDTQIDSPYNTYRYKGFPPSAICNPGIDAINAALYPEKNNYYYLVADTDGSTIFASTYTQHLKNQAAVDAARKNGTSAD